MTLNGLVEHALFTLINQPRRVAGGLAAWMIGCLLVAWFASRSERVLWDRELDTDV